MKILLTAIFKDDSEIKEITRMLKSYMPYMDGLAVAITGTCSESDKNKIKNLVNSYNGQYVVTNPETHPKLYLDGKFAHFAEARNVVFKLARKMQKEGKYDWWSWADSDDVLLSGAGLKNIAKQAEGMDWAHFPYWYAVKQNEQGDIVDLLVEHSRERLLSPKIEWKWKSRLHEVCLPVDQNYEPEGVRIEYNKEEGGTQTVWCHLPPDNHFEPNLERNVRILELQVKEEDGKDPRTIFYLAKCYIDLSERGKPKLLRKAKEMLEQYLKVSGWAEERGFACQYLGMIAVKEKRLGEAKEWYHRAIKEHPVSHLPYLWLANIYMVQNMDEEADHWLDVAMHLPPPSTRSTIGTPMEIKMLASKLLYNQAMKKMDIPEAIKYKKISNELEDIKEDPIIKELEDIKETNDAAIWMQNYAMYLKNKGYDDQIESLISAMAPEFRNEMFAQKIIREFQKPKTWKGVVYLAASAFAPFDPRTAMDEGIGGSETAVMRLSQEWAKDMPVTVFANVTSDCTVSGVDYKHWNQFNWADTFDTLIVWRNTPMLDNPMKAKKILVDLHDITSDVEMKPERVAKVHKFMVKSNYHRENIPSVPDEKIQIISNGI